MEIIAPHKISTEIIDIIYESKMYLVLVSPYVNLANWDRLKTELINAIKRGVKVEFFVRNEPENAKSWEQLSELGLQARLVTNLHAKFYFNESKGLISSMNLLGSSNSNSIEIASILDSTEIDKLKKFVKDFLVVNESKELPSTDDLYLSKEKFIVALQNYVGHYLNSNTRIFYRNGSFQINTLSNQFFMDIDKVNNRIVLDAIITVKGSEAFEKNKSEFFRCTYFNYQLNLANKGYHNTICAISKVRLSNSFLDNLRVKEKKELIHSIASFLKEFNKFKNASC